MPPNARCCGAALTAEVDAVQVVAIHSEGQAEKAAVLAAITTAAHQHQRQHAVVAALNSFSGLSQVPLISICGRARRNVAAAAVLYSSGRFVVRNFSLDVLV